MRQITRDLDNLRDNEIISILLFSLYKLSEDPEYSAISELAYILDKDSLYKLCATYGGCTIKIPTITELKNLTKALLLIQMVSEGESFVSACKELNITDDKKDIFVLYTKLSEIIEEYYEANR